MPMSHRSDKIRRKLRAHPANKETIMFRRFALIGFVGLTFATFHATAVADDPVLHPGPQAQITFLLEQIAADGNAAPPALELDELDLLLAGEPVIKAPEEPEDDANDEVSEFGIWGLKIVEAPRLLVWSTVMGAASEPHVRLTRAYLSRLPMGSYVRYQHINLPWPVRDRHWVILCEKNLDLAKSSNGITWQHRWALQDDGPQMLLDGYAQGRIEGLSKEDLDKSVYLPANRGAWTVADLGNGRSLVIGYFDAALGGLLPKILVRRYSKHQMRVGLKHIEELAARVHLDYDGEPKIHDGIGQPILPQDILRVAHHGEKTNNPAAEEMREFQ